MSEQIKGWIPIIAASVVAGFQLIWNATQYHNPVSSADIQLAGVTFGAVFGIVYGALHTQPPAGEPK